MLSQSHEFFQVQCSNPNLEVPKTPRLFRRQLPNLPTCSSQVGSVSRRRDIVTIRATVSPTLPTFSKKSARAMLMEAEKEMEEMEEWRTG